MKGQRALPKVGYNKGQEEYIDATKKLMEARMLRAKSKQDSDIEKKERNFCQYVNGPNKDIAINKESHEIKKQMPGLVDAPRKKWDTHQRVGSEKREEDYANPFSLDKQENSPSVSGLKERKRWNYEEEVHAEKDFDFGLEEIPSNEFALVKETSEPDTAPKEEPSKPEDEENYSDSFEEEEEGGKEKALDEDKMEKAIKCLDKKDRDILRESLSTMKFVARQPAHANVDEEDIFEDVVAQKQSKEEDKDKSEGVAGKNADKKPSMPKYTAKLHEIGRKPTQSQPETDKNSDISNDLINAIKEENESVKRSEKKQIPEEKQAIVYSTSHPFSQRSGKKQSYMKSLAKLTEVPATSFEVEAKPKESEAKPKEVEEVKQPKVKAQNNDLENLLRRLQCLDSDKIEKFSRLLDIVEKSAPSVEEPTNVQKSMAPEKMNFPPIAMPFETPIVKSKDKIGHEITTSEKEDVKKDEKAKKVQAKKNELIFRVLSTWGHPHVVGLTEIELYDTEGKKLNPLITVKNLGAGPTQLTSKLMNGKIYTNDEKNMWVAFLPLPPKSLELVLSLPPESPAVGGISVWNYNKSSLDSVKGVRKAEIYYNGVKAWEDTIKRAHGRTGEDYSTEIFLGDNKNAFKNKPRGDESETGESEAEMPKELAKIKQEIEDNCSRPISVPIWLTGHQVEYSMGKRPEPAKKEDRSQMQESTQASQTKQAENYPDIKKFGMPGRRSKKVFTDKPQVTPAMQAKPILKAEANLQPFLERGRKIDRKEQPRDQSVDMNIDSLIYFEASKAQRLLKGNDVKPILPSSFSPKKAVVPKKDEGRDIIDEFIQQREMKVPKVEDKPLTITFERLKAEYQKSDDFVIPELPSGKVLNFEIISTWSDQHYVGLAGIEIFNDLGMPVKIHPQRITADPRDINILPEYGTDPRTVDKLVDGVYLTKNDLHVWLAPYTLGNRHYIQIDLGLATAISMIRIWNYNKSRIHADRGVKDLTISLDNKSTIFMGEVRRAPGGLNDISQCCEVIMFTSNAHIRQAISDHDWIENVEIDRDGGVEQPTEERPPTASRKYTVEEVKQMKKKIAEQSDLERPLTTAMTDKHLAIKEQIALKDKELAMLQHEAEKKKAKSKSLGLVTGSLVTINVLETWGDLYYVGLTGIELYNDKDEVIRVDTANITANPKDLNSVPGYSGDYRTLDKLIDGSNLTTDDKHMWIIPYTKGLSHTITITLPRPTCIKGIKFFNYNKSVEDTNRGAKTVTISVDKKMVTPNRGVTLRKAPGNALLDYGHFIKLPYTADWDDSEIAAYNRAPDPKSFILQEYYTLNLPTGFTFEFALYSTFGDIHYIGLNGLEIYDLLGRPLLQPWAKKTVEYQIKANPSSVSTLKGMENDIRTIDKLVDGVNKTNDDTHMWLAPMKNTKIYAVTNREIAKAPNTITVAFSNQVAISAIKLWNYSKTPSRGVQEYSLFCDSKLIYRGYMSQQHDGMNKGEEDSTSVFFTTDPKIREQIGGDVHYTGGKEQDVRLVNEKAIVSKHARETKVDAKMFEIERPLTTVAGRK